MTRIPAPELRRYGPAGCLELLKRFLWVTAASWTASVSELFAEGAKR
jgi:hypothetical protein